MSASPGQPEILAQLGTFLRAVLPPGSKVVRGQQNRVPEPKEGSFALMIPQSFRRLETNVDGYEDAAFTASIAADTMTVTAVDPRFPGGELLAGSQLFGAGLAANMKVVEVLTGTGQVGTYRVAPAQSVAARTVSAGTKQATQAGTFEVLVAFHSADQSAFDMAATFSTLLRDEYGVQQFANQDPDHGVVPLYADDPAQRPFLNDQQQFEWLWSVSALLQANVMVSVPQEFADSAVLTTVSVEAAYPP